MSDVVWISTAPGHPSNLRPFRHSLSDDDHVQFAIDSKKRNMSGEPLAAAFFPDEIYGAPDARGSDYRLPDLFHAGSFWVVSMATAAVLRQFDLGGGALYQVRVLQKDRRTPVEGEWYCINFGNRKDSFLPERSSAFRERYIRDGTKGWIAKATMKDDDFAVSTDALSGCDIWIDYNVGDAFFISNGLRMALRSAKCDKGFYLNRCRVI